MTSIRIGNLRIRLASESRNLFNPSYAFGVQRLAPGSGGVLALRDSSSHDVLLPIDSEGNVIVRPGRDYELIRVMERHSANTNKSPAAVPDKNASAATPADATAHKGKNKQVGRPRKTEAPADTSTPGSAVAAVEHAGAKRPRDASPESAKDTPVASATAAPPADDDADTHRRRKAHKSQSPPKEVHAVAEEAAAKTSAKASPKSTPKAAPAPATAAANDLPLFMQFGDGNEDEPVVQTDDSVQREGKKRGRKKKVPEEVPVVPPTTRERSASPPDAAPVTLPPSTRASTVRRPRPPLQDSSSDSD